MRFEILVHGKPSEGELISLGQIGTGIEEQIYKEFFGSNLKPSVSPCFVYEIRKWKEVLYSVYSIYNDGKDFFGCGNGYNVVSVLVEGRFTKDYDKINDLLTRLYDSLLSNNIISATGKYIVRSLTVNVNLVLMSSIAKDSLGQMHFSSLDGNETFGRPSDNAICLNPKDANSELVYSGLKEQGRVYVSSNYKSFEQLENERLQRQRESERSRNTMKMKPANNESEKSLKESSEAKSLDSLSHKIDLLLQRIASETRGDFSMGNAGTAEQDATHVKYSIKGVSIFNWITVVNCLLLLLCLFRCNTNSHGNNEGGYSPVEVTDSTKDSTIESAKESASTIQGGDSKLQKENEETKQIVAVLENNPYISIDIEGISKSKISKDKPYGLTLLIDKQVVPISLDNFKFGSELTVNQNEDGSFSITGNQIGHTKIGCYIGDYLFVERKIEVVQ